MLLGFVEPLEAKLEFTQQPVSREVEEREEMEEKGC
jgi:hypothetical protein